MLKGRWGRWRLCGQWGVWTDAVPSPGGTGTSQGLEAARPLIGRVAPGGALAPLGGAPCLRQMGGAPSAAAGHRDLALRGSAHHLCFTDSEEACCPPRLLARNNDLHEK